jgi:hypothetical protein
MSIEFVGPHKLKAVLLEDVSDDDKRKFAKMLAEECATADRQAKGHKCWLYVPSVAEYERMKRYAVAPNYDKCPKCEDGRVKIELFHSSIGISMTLVCINRDRSIGCDFNEYISDDA